MHAYDRRLFGIAVVSSVVSLALCIFTVIEPQWIERLFEVAPDHSDGSAERWLVGGAFLAAGLVTAGAALRLRARRNRRSPS